LDVVVPPGKRKKDTHEQKEEAAENYPHSEAFGFSCLLKVYLSRRERERERESELLYRHKQGVPRHREP